MVYGMSLARLALAGALAVGVAQARLPKPPGVGPIHSRNGTELPPYNTTYYFDQLIDHNDPSKGTFKQRYWHTYEHYEEGGPVIIMTPGEGNADGYWSYLTNSSINGLLAEQENATAIVIEHRFYGESNPLPDLSSESLKLHTIQQAIDDLKYFAENVVLPMPNGDQLTPDKAPWVMMGGSYSGALTSWVMTNTDFIWAGYASSAVVEAITDFWKYFEPIRQNMPQNCSADVQAVITYIDDIAAKNDTDALNKIADDFGLSDIADHFDDVVGTLRYNLWDWQSLSILTGPNGAFYQFCDALEVKDNGDVAPEAGWGVDHAYAAWSSYFKNQYIDDYLSSGGYDSVFDAFDTYDTNRTFWTSTEVDNSYRSWQWIVCNEVGYIQDAAPEGEPSLISRIVNPAYDLRQCVNFFPDYFPETPVPNVNATNTAYKGWDVQEDRLFFANGIKDPWREATMSAEGVTTKSTDRQPIKIGDGIHCSDLSAKAGKADETIRAVQESALEYLHTWIGEWKTEKAKRA
ncbi:peptidase S28 [Schizophyllum commune]